MGVQFTRFFGIKCALKDGSAYELISNAGSSDSENSEAEWHSILQFTSALYFVEEHEATVQIDIMRLGSQSGQVSVDFHTEDMTGKAGERFEETHGCLVLDDREQQKAISVPIVMADTWAPTLEFKVCLTRPKRAKLGAYLHTCRVKVIAGKSFPSSKYPEVTGNLKDIENIGALSLFIEFFKLIFSVPGIGVRTLLCMIFDQLRNAYTYYKLWAIAYLLNHVLHGTDENLTIDERAEEAVFIGAGYILPMIALHAWDLTKTQLDLAGRAKTYLQKSIITKYLNYSNESRASVDIADIEIAIKEDARETAETYVAALEFFRIVVKLIVVLGFVRKENPNSIHYVIAMLVLMFVFASLRSTSLSRASALPITLAARLQSYVADTGRNYRLIANYLQRPQVNDAIDHKVAALRTAEASPNFVRVNNDYFTQWLGPLFVGMYIMTHARFVLLGELGHGTFIATLNVFNEYSVNFSAGYKESMKITANAGTLANITRMLNLPTDLLAWKAVNRMRRARTKEVREVVLGQHLGHDNLFPTDLIPFRLRNVGFGFADKEKIMRGLTLTVPQGCMVAIRGDHGTGKQTLLRLIAHELFPTEGEIFIPTHLRILHVSQEVYMLDTNPLLNLTFGHVGVEIERVRVVLEQLGITKLWDQVNAAHAQQLRKTMLSSAKSSPRTLSSKSTHRSSTSLDSEIVHTEDLEEDFLFRQCSMCNQAEEQEFESTDCTWLNALSYSERAKVHLARALIMNPEVMILQRPLVHFNQVEQTVILDVLHQHVRNRGLALPQEHMRMRRPRTAFLSVETPEQADKADIVWEMCRGESSMDVKVKKDSVHQSKRA